MKTRFYSRLCVPTLLGLSLMAVVMALMTMPPAVAQQDKSRPERMPINITADKLVTDNEKKTAQFTGNVKAVQGDTVITTDRLTIFYKSKGDESTAGSQANIERLEAKGNVRIEFDNKVAVSNQAVYIIAERKLVLTGPDSKVISDKDEISGSRITFYRDDGRVSLEGDGENRVKAIIHSDQRGLN